MFRSTWSVVFLSFWGLTVIGSSDSSSASRATTPPRTVGTPSVTVEILDAQRKKQREEARTQHYAVLALVAAPPVVRAIRF